MIPFHVLCTAPKVDRCIEILDLTFPKQVDGSLTLGSDFQLSILSRAFRPQARAVEAPMGMRWRASLGPCRAVLGALVEPLSLDCVKIEGHVGTGDGRKRCMAARMRWNRSLLMMTSASWKVMARACRTTRAPILIRRVCRLASDQVAISAGRSAV